MKTHKAILLLIITLSFKTIYTQVPNGTWRDNFSCYRGKCLALTKDKVYCGFESGGMLSYDKGSGELEKISKVTGLTDIDITALCYAESSNLLVIGYKSGNLDILSEDGKVNIPDIVNKSMSDSKIINKIKVYDNLAYLACDFGIVVIDLLKNQVKDSYMFGTGGTTIQVNDLEIYNNTIYAATKLGLYYADINAPNLLDNSFWNTIDDTPYPNAEFKDITQFNNKLVTSYENPSSNHDEIIYLESNNWHTLNYITDTLVYSLDVSNDQLAVSAQKNVYIYKEGLVLAKTYSIDKSYQFLQDKDGSLYTSSFGNGFAKIVSEKPERLSVNSPQFNPKGYVATKEGQVWVTSGGPHNPYKEGGGYNFQNDRWNSMVSGWNGGLTNVGNLYKVVYHPTNKNRIFASGYLYGIYDIEDRQVKTEYTYDNTAVFNSTVGSNVGVRAMGLGFDSKGNLWTVFNETDNPVYVLRDESKWENLELKSLIFNSNQNYKDLLVTRNDQVWILSKSKGIVVLKEQPDGTILETSFSIKNQDNNSMATAYCLAEDKDGNVWVGTNRGPLYYPEMANIFDAENISGNSIKIPRSDGTGAADYLLDYEVVNDIAIDGANRKWMATESSGVFLVSSDGLKTVHQFTKDNSRLISNNIISVGVQEETGEVFFSTNKGLVSYMGTATEGNEDFTDVYVYPNPVRPGYEGNVTITGLIEDANVKITDISGNLVYETTSLGGQAIWNGKNFDGQRVSTGVYLVFMTNDDGSKTHITKLVFIH